MSARAGFDETPALANRVIKGLSYMLVGMIHRAYPQFIAIDKSMLLERDYFRASIRSRRICAASS